MSFVTTDIVNARKIRAGMPVRSNAKAASMRNRHELARDRGYFVDRSFQYKRMPSNSANTQA